MMRAATRAVVIIVYLLLCVVLLFSGKRHSLLIDNDASLVSGAAGLAEGELLVKIDGGEEIELAPKDRTEVKVKGVFHDITVVVKDASENGASTGRKIAKSFRLALHDPLLLSMPALLAGRSDWIQPFVVEEEQAPEEEPAPAAGEAGALPGVMAPAGPDMTPTALPASPASGAP